MSTPVLDKARSFTLSPVPPGFRFYYAAVFLLYTLHGLSQPVQPLDSARKYRTTHPDRAMNFARTALGQARGEAEKSKSLLVLGVLNQDLSQYDSALWYLGQSLELFKLLKDSSGIGEALHSIGAAKEHLGLYQESLEYFEQSYEIRKKLGLKSEVAFSLNSIGNIYVYFFICTGNICTILPGVW